MPMLSGIAICNGCVIVPAEDEDPLSLLLLVPVFGDVVREGCFSFDFGFVLRRGKLVDADADAGADISTDSGG